MNLHEEVRGRRVLFISTKRADYIRNSQEIRILHREAASATVLCSGKRGYAGRLAEIWLRLLLLDLSGFEVIFAGFAPQLVLPLFYRRFRGKRIIIDFFISLHDTLAEERRVVSRSGLAAGFLLFLDRRTIRLADGVIVDTRAHRDYFCRRFELREENSQVLYLEADPAVYAGGERRERKGPFTVLYFGTGLPHQGIGVILEAAAGLAAEEGLHFELIGTFGRKDRAKGRGNVSFLPWQPEERLAERIAGADLCLAGHFNGKLGKAWRTIPGKAFIYEAMGKRMILGDTPANRERFCEDENHFFVPLSDPSALAEVIGREAGIGKRGGRDGEGEKRACGQHYRARVQRGSLP